jgi:archaellum biogenesis ATPase FlaH
LQYALLFASIPFKSILFTKDNKDKLYEEILNKLSLNANEVIIVDDRILRGIAWGNKKW